MELSWLYNLTTERIQRAEKVKQNRPDLHELMVERVIAMGEAEMLMHLGRSAYTGAPITGEGCYLQSMG